MSVAEPTSVPKPNFGVNDTPLRRFAVLAAIKLLKRIRPRIGNVLFLTDKLCVKYGPLKPLSEAFTLHFVANHTTIPVPKVYCAFVHNGWTYTVMERIKGEAIANTWHSRSGESKAKILAQLREMVKEWRKLPPPGPGVAHVGGGPLYDGRLPGTSLTFGPFKTIQDFHSFLRNGHRARPDHIPEINNMISLQDRPWPMPVFTHGDLSSFNIIVRGDEVVGIIDWETAGWYPSYWEYTTFLEPMPQELEMEKIRQRYFGDF
ncbi:kinase-like domain-containing protein [Phlebopus sp. FC_14]|nr:kinase-like domain-containing protein [Phlebopus sp. FC_14]